MFGTSGLSDNRLRRQTPVDIVPTARPITKTGRHPCNAGRKTIGSVTSRGLAFEHLGILQPEQAAHVRVFGSVQFEQLVALTHLEERFVFRERLLLERTSLAHVYGKGKITSPRLHLAVQVEQSLELTR